MCLSVLWFSGKYSHQINWEKHQKQYTTAKNPAQLPKISKCCATTPQKSITKKKLEKITNCYQANCCVITYTTSNIVSHHWHVPTVLRFNCKCPHHSDWERHHYTRNKMHGNTTCIHWRYPWSEMYWPRTWPWITIMHCSSRAFFTGCNLLPCVGRIVVTIKMKPDNESTVNNTENKHLNICHESQKIPEISGKLWSNSYILKGCTLHSVPAGLCVKTLQSYTGNYIPCGHINITEAKFYSDRTWELH